jgi:hypothetical protein
MLASIYQWLLYNVYVVQFRYDSLPPHRPVRYERAHSISFTYNTLIYYVYVYSYIIHSIAIIIIIEGVKRNDKK